MYVLWGKIYFIRNSFWKNDKVKTKKVMSEIDADSGHLLKVNILMQRYLSQAIHFYSDRQKSLISMQIQRKKNTHC